MKKELKKSLIFLIIIIFLFFNAYSVKAFSFLNFLEQVKNKILNPQQEKIIKEIEAKKITLEKTIDLINNNNQEEIKLFKKYCPLAESKEYNTSTKNIFKKIIYLYNLKQATSSLPTSSLIAVESSSSQEKPIQTLSLKQLFNKFSADLKENILFKTKICKGLNFLIEENNWYTNFENNLKTIKTIEEINVLIRKLKSHRLNLEEKNDSVSKISMILTSLENISLAKNRANKINNALQKIGLDKFSQKIIEKLFILAKTKIKIAALETQKAKLIVLYLDPIDEIWEENNKQFSSNVDATSMAVSSTDENSDQKERLKKEIALKIKLEKEKITTPVIDLLTESQNYLKSAYQDFTFISKLVQKD